MKHLFPLAFGFAIVSLLACEPVNNVDNGNCEISGLRLSATINSQFWCASFFLTANLINNQVVIEGASGADFLTLRFLDYNVPGTYTTDATFNTIQYSSSIMGNFESSDFSPGQLRITEHDAADNILKGTIDATLISGLGENVLISGEFDVIYIE